MNSIKEISVVVPVYNSEHSLNELKIRLDETLKKITTSYELIFVDDFSTDHSWEQLKKIQSENANITILRLSKNYGQHNATLCGLKEAEGETIITLDDDLEHRPEDIPLLYEQFLEKNYDILYAYPRKRRKNFLRNLLGYLWYKGSKTIDKGIGKASSFRVLKKTISDCLLNHNEPFLFIESIISWYTSSIGQTEVEFEIRKHGKSNYSILSLFTLNHDIGMHYDTHILKFMKNFGVTVFFSSLVLISYYLLKKIFGSPTPGYTSIIIVSLFSTGSILWGMGYLGVYIGKMFRILNKEPQYRVSEKIKTTRL